MSNFSTPSKIQQTIRASDVVELRRGQNRVKINDSANCAPPLDAELARQLQIKINVNFGEMMVLLAHARRQYLTAFWSQPYFFKVRMPLAPSDKQSEWEAFITETINKPLRKSNAYFELHRSRWASVTCHGMGPQVWYHSDMWMPKFMALPDVRIPTDTTMDFENLDWFCIRRLWTPMELVDEVFPAEPKAVNNWNKPAVARILQNYKQLNVSYAPTHYDWMTSPEKLASLVRQDGGYWSSSAVPTIPLNGFYFKDNTQKNNKGWFLRTVPESSGIIGGAGEEDFLYTSDKPIAKELKNIFHCQFGDLNNDAPFKVHGIRSLGFVLLEPCFYSNLTKCRALQHLNDQFNILLRITDPADKARAAIQEFSNMGVVRSGVSIIPQSERHQVDPNLIEMVQAQLKQLMQEASSTYTQSTDTGTSREQTAYETSVKMQQVNAMTSGLLMTAFRYATSEYEEICRRFCIQGSEDEDVQKFQSKCQKMGIPMDFLDSEDWDVEACSPLGMGNPAMAMTQAQQLMSVSGALDATAQQEVKHEYVLAVTGDARKASRLVPLDKPRSTTQGADSAHKVFGSLMQGIPFRPTEGVSPIDEFEALLPLYAGKIALIERRNNVATSDEAAGLSATSGYLWALIQALQSDPQQKQRVKQYSDAMGNLDNQSKGLAQRGAEQQQQQQGNQMDPEADAKVHALMLTTAAKIHAKEQSDQQKHQQKDEGFVREQRRKDAATFAETQRQKTRTDGEVEAMKIKADAAPAPATNGA